MQSQVVYYKTLYCTLIQSYLSYGILIWGSTCKSYLDKLVKLKKWAILMVCSSQYRSHTGPLFAKCYFLTFTDMYTLELGVFMYRISISDLPVAFKEYFSKRSEIHDYPTRHINDLRRSTTKKILIFYDFVNFEKKSSSVPLICLL